jgi:hypothetical protein
MDEEMLKKAEELLGQPLPPKDSPQFVEALAQLARKDPVLAKVLLAAAKGATVPKEVPAGVEKKVKAALTAAERQARLRDSFRRVYERFFVRPASVAGRKVKVPVKGAWILVILLALGGVLGFLWFSMRAPQQQSQKALGLPAGKLQEASAEDLRKEAEKVLGKPLPKPGESGYEESLQELSKLDPKLAQALRDKEQSALLTAQADSAARNAVEGIMGKTQEVQDAQTKAEEASQPPEKLPAEGEAVPPPPAATPPPTVPPPPNTASGSPQTGEQVLPYTMQERTLRPFLMEGQGGAGQPASGQGGGQESGQESGQGGAPRAGGPFFLEGKTSSAPLASEKDRNRATSLTEGQGGSRGQTLLLVDRGGGGGVSAAPMGNSPFGPPSPEASSGAGARGFTLVERTAAKETGKGTGGWQVLAESASQGSSPQSTPQTTPSANGGGPLGLGTPPSGGLAQDLANAVFGPPPSGSPQGQTSSPLSGQAPLPSPSAPGQTQTPPASPAPQAQQSYPYQPGKTLTARLNVKLAVVEGSESPAVLEGADGSIWVGKAKLGPLARVMVELDTLYLGGKSYRVRAYAYDQDRQLGLTAKVEEQSPSLAQDVLRASAAALGQYVDLLSKQTQVTQLPGGGVAQSQTAPPLEMVILGSVGRLFALPEDRKSLVRVAQVEAGKVVQILVMGFE